MRIPGRKSLKLSARWLRSRFVDGALILGYHRIAEAAWDPDPLCVTPRHFAEQLQVVQKHACPISLQQLIRARRDVKVPKRAVVLTFDDGYADNLYTAKPLLARYQIPATVFISTGHLGREFWWDELNRIMLTAATLPERLCLTVNGGTYGYELGDTDNAPKKAGSNPRQRVLLSLYQQLQSLSGRERQNAMEQLRIWAGAESKGDPIHRAMTSDEVIQLAKGGLVEVGAHTVSHPVLTTLSPTMQEDEIRQSKACLEELLGQPVTSFSYPNGSLSDDTVSMVQEAGFACACTSFPDVVWHGSDPFCLPRFWVKDWGGTTFSRWLQRWIHT